MVKYILGLVLSICFLHLSPEKGYSQYRSPAGSGNLGISGSVGINFLEGAQFLQIKPGSSLTAGVSLKYYQTITLGFQADILFLSTSCGYSRVQPIQTANVKVNYKQSLSYLSIPLITNFYLSDRYESEVVYLTLGVVPAFLLSAKLKNDLNENSDPTESNVSDFKKMDFSLIAGIGLEIRRIDFQFEYVLGLHNNNSQPEGSKITNHGPRIRVNYFLKRWD